MDLIDTNSTANTTAEVDAGSHHNSSMAAIMNPSADQQQEQVIKISSDGFVRFLKQIKLNAGSS